MRFLKFEDIRKKFAGRTVAVVGSAPSVLDNVPGFVDSHDIVVRVNNYKTGREQGFRSDVHYSFYGTSIRKPVEQLKHDGVELCMCKCPDAKPIQSEWHEARKHYSGIDFRYIYTLRKAFWFCDTHIPEKYLFLDQFHALQNHVPTTGFSAYYTVLECAPKSLYLTGFDLFSSGIHNVNEKWRAGDPRDPIGHRPELEAAWLAAAARRHDIRMDRTLQTLITQRERAVPA